MNNPTVAEFKSQFVRDFPYGSSSDKVMDSDVQSALDSADFGINQGLFALESAFRFTFNYLAAHYLVTSLKNSSQGVNGSFNWIETSKSVGSVSQGFSVPQSVLDNPFYSMISKTSYGAYYLSIVIPLTYGGVVTISGATQA